jgi:4-hydroxy-2-oxoheptanedioate aldolase
MTLERNKLRQILERGEIAFGTGFYSFSPTLVEVAGYCGLDFVRIDNEHAFYSKSTLERMIMAAELAGTTPILRVDRDDPYIIRKALEIGAQGVLVAHINTEEEAQDVVHAAKFPPWGIRGTAMCHANKWNVTVKGSDFIPWSNQETMIATMVEDYRAIDNIEAIASVKGLDILWFGPSDFSVSIGAPGEGLRNKTVWDGLLKTITAAKRYQKHVCLGVGYPWVENARKYIELGVSMIELGHDVSILRATWQKLRGELNKK